MGELAAVGLGLDAGTVRLARTTGGWISAASEIRVQLENRLCPPVVSIEHVGSSSVLELLAKPVIDLAAGLAADQDFALVLDRLAADGWVYVGDAGDAGGHVFALEAQPGHRVAHLHAVVYESPQWRDCLRLRNALRASPRVRARYEAVKLDLAERCPDDRKA